MNIFCCNCGEPWSIDHVIHEAPDDFKREGSKIISCPACKGKGMKLSEAQKSRCEMAATIGKLLGGDTLVSRDCFTYFTTTPAYPLLTTINKEFFMAHFTKTELIKLQKQLGTDEAIGEKFGITRQAVHQMRRKYGIESRYADNPERNAKIIAAYKKGTSGTTLARKYDLSISQAYRIIKMAGKSKKKK